MGYLSNSELTVDAILTKKGREKLASGQPPDASGACSGECVPQRTLARRPIIPVRRWF